MLRVARYVFAWQKLSLGGIAPPPKTQLEEGAQPIARPSKDPTERRLEQISVRLTPKERALISRKADVAQTSVTDFVRAVALGQKVSVQTSRAPDFMTRHELRRIGNNLNQIAHALNAGAQHVPSELSALCEKLDALFEQWLDYGSQDRERRAQL